MKRRTFFKSALALLAGTHVPLAVATSPAPRRLVILHTPIAGAQYYDASQLSLDDGADRRLTLRREADNRYDQRAVALYWHHHKIGYIPRRQNHAIAQMLDRGTRMEAHILTPYGSLQQWEAWEIEVAAVV